jgi:crotonobetainyl-CoA:carnitine CoA-transferase CaiB-like acyl-CoA transferase
MGGVLGGKTRQEIFEDGNELGMPFTVVMSAEEIVNDPQNKHRGAFVTQPHPEMGAVTYPGAPVRFPDTPWRAGHAPLLGEHNREVYCERLGYSPHDLVRLREQGDI